MDNEFAEKILEYIRIRRELIEYIKRHFPKVDVTHDDFFVLRANL